MITKIIKTMKKVLVFSVAMLLLAACNKEKGCSVCTTNLGGTETVANQSTWENTGDGQCKEDQADFKAYLEGIAGTATAGTGIEYSVTCVYE